MLTLKKTLLLVPLMVLAGTAQALPPAGTPQPTGEMMGNTCAGCHGTQGRMHGEAFVPLAGMPEAKFIRAMQDFRSGARPATLMGHVAKGYTDEEIKAMAEFFAKVKP